MVGIFSVGSEGSIHSLQQNFSQLLELQNRLSTGKQINKASDDPAALVISKRLESQVSSFRQGVDNLQRTDNVVATADNALNETSSLLRKAKELVLASTGEFSHEEREVNQQALNEVLSTIDRIAGSSQFGNINLLDGSQEAKVSGVNKGITDVQIDQVGNVFNLSRGVDVEVTAQATRAEFVGTIAGQTADTEFVITGSEGSVTINIPAGASVTDVENAINTQSSLTGVEAVTGKLRSREFGQSERITLRQLHGQLEGISVGTVQGTDIEGTINGTTAVGSGTSLSSNSSDLKATVTFDETASLGSYSFSLDSSGFDANLGSRADAQRSISIPRVSSDTLGQTSGLGSLSSLYSGGQNDLEINPANALEIIDAAIDETSGIRGRLGAFQTHTLQSLENSYESSVIEIESSRSRVEDTDFAATIAEYSKKQIQEQVQVALQAQIQGLNRSVLMGLLIT